MFARFLDPLIRFLDDATGESLSSQLRRERQMTYDLQVQLDERTAERNALLKQITNAPPIPRPGSFFSDVMATVTMREAKSEARNVLLETALRQVLLWADRYHQPMRWPPGDGDGAGEPLRDKLRKLLP